MPVECTRCGSDDLERLEVLEDDRRRLRCNSCGNEWLRGEAKRVYKKIDTIDDLRRRFPSPDDVPPTARERADSLREEFLARNPAPRENATEFRSRFRRLFSEDVLPRAPAEDLRYFANANIGGNPGNMSVFNTEWNALGDEEAASRVREAIGYLLYGSEGTHIEDRLTNLIHGERGFGMKGFREALLTKVLCMVEPQRFIPILVYTGRAGKYEVARSVYNLPLPHPEAVSWTIGRLVFWSNNLLTELVGPGFVDSEHAAEFLWWAKDLPSPWEA